MSDAIKIKELEEKILYHKNLYYQGRPEISDFEFDKIEEELRTLNPHSEILNLVGSKTGEDSKVKHDVKMLSLNKTYSFDDLVSWMGDNQLISTFKIDGSSCSLIYIDGKLAVAKTRGDGTFGENITSKVMHINHIPKEINQDGKVEIRGEVFCREENFFHLSEEMTKRGLEKPTSQRNIVAGLLGRKEQVDLCSFLSFQAFELIEEQRTYQQEREKFIKLIHFGFETPEYFLNNTQEELEQRIQEARDFMGQGDYLIDGLVFSYNQLSLHEELGSTSHHPRYKLAYKFQGETKQTTIDKIIWQVSRNGILTPVAVVNPTQLSGAVVSRVTLHNWGLVKQYQLKTGDVIEIVRSGEVIPKFLKVVRGSTSSFLAPNECPSCGGDIIEEDIRLICPNDNCPDKILDDILNFVKKIGIDDLSSKRLEEMIKAKLIKDSSSLYLLAEEDLLNLDKVKEKMAKKIIKNINKTRNVDLVTFLSALGLSGGARNKCEKIISAGHDTLDKVLNLTLDQLIEVESFAEKSASEFLRSLADKASLVKKLIQNGVKIEPPAAKGSEALIGKSFCITGSLTLKRSDIEELIKKNSGKILSSVTKNTDFLVTNDKESTSSKFVKAQKLQVPIINEEQLFSMIGIQHVKNQN